MTSDLDKESLELHKKLKGKMHLEGNVKMKDMHDMSTLYTPGVAEPSRYIHDKPGSVYDLTMKHNSVAIVTDGSRVLGLGNVGAEAALPVMEGKALIMKQFANIDAFPICVRTQKKEEIVETVKNIEPVFGAINLEDIETPKVFEIEEQLIKELPIPVFHDDQHGTAMVVLAGLINALQIVGKKKEDVKLIMIGAGSAGYAIVKLLRAFGVQNIVTFDSKGAISKKRNDLGQYKSKLLEITNQENYSGALAEYNGADVTISAAAPGALPKKTIENMNKDKIVFALANPISEISIEEAKQLGIRVFATGRSDYPNQVNNAICFPGFLRALLDFRVKKITDKMKIAAAQGIAKTIPKTELCEGKIVPEVFDKSIVGNICQEVKKTL